MLIDQTTNQRLTMNFEASAAAAPSDIRTTETVTTLEPIPMAHTNQIVAHLEPQREVVPFILYFFTKICQEIQLF